MTSDDMLAYLARHPKSKRPTELRSDVRMLWVWLKLRSDQEFYEDVILRHGMKNMPIGQLNESLPIDGHAVGNAWSHCMQAWVEHSSHNSTEQGGNDAGD